MFQFLFAFVFAVATVYRESPPAVGVGKSSQEAKTHIEFLDTCTQLNWTAAKQLREGLVFQIKGEYTVCQRTLNKKSWLVCLVGAQLSDEAIKAGVESLLAEYNKIFDGQGKLTDYATQSCQPYDHQPVIELVVSMLPGPQIQQAIPATVTSSTQSMKRPAHWPVPEFASGGFDVAATLNGFFKPVASVPHSSAGHRVYASPVLVELPVFNNPVQCVGLWGDTLDLLIVMTSESALILKEKLGDETEAYIYTEHKHSVIIPAAKAHEFMQVLSDREDDQTIAWMQQNPKHHFQGRIDCRPKM